MNQQLEFTYDLEDSYLPDDISERISRDGASSVSTHDLASLLFDEDHAIEAITALQEVVFRRGDLRELPATTSKTMAAMELIRRIIDNHKCTGPADIFRLVNHLAYDTPYQETFAVVTLDGSHSVIRPVVITQGLLNRTLIHPREVFASALEDHAAAVVLVHTHPSGNTEPSSDDLEATYRLRKAGELLGIPVLDHIIISKTGYHSMAESGELL